MDNVKLSIEQLKQKRQSAHTSLQKYVNQKELSCHQYISSQGSVLYSSDEEISVAKQSIRSVPVQSKSQIDKLSEYKKQLIPKQPIFVQKQESQELKQQLEQVEKIEASKVVQSNQDQQLSPKQHQLDQQQPTSQVVEENKQNESQQNQELQISYQEINPSQPQTQPPPQESVQFNTGQQEHQNLQDSNIGEFPENKGQEKSLIQWLEDDLSVQEDIQENSDRKIENPSNKSSSLFGISQTQALEYQQQFKSAKIEENQSIIEEDGQDKVQSIVNQSNQEDSQSQVKQQSENSHDLAESEPRSEIVPPQQQDHQLIQSQNMKFPNIQPLENNLILFMDEDQSMEDDKNLSSDNHENEYISNKNSSLFGITQKLAQLQEQNLQFQNNEEGEQYFQIISEDVQPIIKVETEESIVPPGAEEQRVSQEVSQPTHREDLKTLTLPSSHISEELPSPVGQNLNYNQSQKFPTIPHLYGSYTKDMLKTLDDIQSVEEEEEKVKTIENPFKGNESNQFQKQREESKLDIQNQSQDRIITIHQEIENLQQLRQKYDIGQDSIDDLNHQNDTMYNEDTDVLVNNLLEAKAIDKKYQIILVFKDNVQKSRIKNYYRMLVRKNLFKQSAIKKRKILYELKYLTESRTQFHQKIMKARNMVKLKKQFIQLRWYAYIQKTKRFARIQYRNSLFKKWVKNHKISTCNNDIKSLSYFYYSQVGKFFIKWYKGSKILNRQKMLVKQYIRNRQHKLKIIYFDLLKKGATLSLNNQLTFATRQTSQKVKQF